MGSKGESSGYDILTDLHEEVNPFRCCLLFFIPMHHDKLVIISSGTPSYLRKDKGQLGYNRMLRRETIRG